MKAINRISLIQFLIILTSIGLSALVQAQENMIALSSDGTVLVMDQAAAIRYCSSSGLHLPTAREWAEAVQNMGVQKIIETHRPNTSATVDQETVQCDTGCSGGHLFQRIAMTAHGSFDHHATN